MSTQSVDPEQYKEGQRQEWGTVATGWRKWWETFEKGAQHLSNRLVELSQIQPGHRVLDVATGIGEPAVTAAQHVGPSGRVVATDLSVHMLTIAKDRAAALGLQNIEFLEMDAETLDLPEDTFDAILCRWGLMFLPNLATALRTMRQLLAPGGRLAAAVWDVPAKVPLISLPTAVVRGMFDVPAPPPGTPSPFALADTSVLEKVLTQAGFAQVNIVRVTVTYEFASVDTYTGYLQDTSPSIRRVLRNQPGGRQEEVWQAISEAAQEKYAAAEGSIRIPNETICVVGRS